MVMTVAFSVFSLRVDDEVELRAMEESDGEDFHRLNSTDNANMKQWLPASDTARTLEETQEFIAQLKAGYAQDRGIAVGIWYKSRLAGFLDAQRIKWSHKKTELGFWLGTSFEGKGIMTRSCRALIDHNFRELGLNRVEMECAAGNIDGRKVAERLGFTQEGVVRQAAWLNDRFVDHILYGLLVDEWRAGDQSGPTNR
jgi:ribosomal-protein-serine acetyltransferase